MKNWLKSVFSRHTPSDGIRAEAILYVDALYAAALRLTKNPADAEDLVQDTFARAMRFEDRYTEGSNLKAWLFQIQFHLFVNRYRRRIRERSHVDAYVNEGNILPVDAPASCKDPEINYLRNILSKDVVMALESLSEDYRMVVMLSDIHEFTYKEIAEILGVPIGTVMSRLFRGRQMLRQELLSYAQESGLLDGATNVTKLSDYRMPNSRKKEGI